MFDRSEGTVEIDHERTQARLITNRPSEALRRRWRPLVIGGGGGLGKSLASALRDAGAQVAIVGRSERVKAERDGMVPIVRDLAVPGAAPEVVAECTQLFGGLDILVNAHGIAPRAEAEEFDLASWQTTIDINLVSVFSMCQAAGREFLRAGRGKIINIASMLEFFGRTLCL